MDEWEIEVIGKEHGWVDFDLTNNKGLHLMFCKNVDHPLMGEVYGGYKQYGTKRVLVNVGAEYLEKAGVDIPALRAMAMMMRE